jgi:hypothetical protein
MLLANLKDDSRSNQTDLLQELKTIVATDEAQKHSRDIIPCLANIIRQNLEEATLSAATLSSNINIVQTLGILNTLSRNAANTTTLIKSGLPTLLVAVIGTRVSEYMPLTRTLMKNMDSLGAQLRGGDNQTDPDGPSSAVIKALRCKPKRLQRIRQVKQELQEYGRRKEEEATAKQERDRVEKTEEMRRGWKKAAMERKKRERLANGACKTGTGANSRNLMETPSTHTAAPPTLCTNLSRMEKHRCLCCNDLQCLRTTPELLVYHHRDSSGQQSLSESQPSSHTKPTPATPATPATTATGTTTHTVVLEPNTRKSDRQKNKNLASSTRSGLEDNGHQRHQIHAPSTSGMLKDKPTKTKKKWNYLSIDNLASHTAMSRAKQLSAEEKVRLSLTNSFTDSLPVAIGRTNTKSTAAGAASISRTDTDTDAPARARAMTQCRIQPPPGKPKVKATPAANPTYTRSSTLPMLHANAK